MNDKMHLLVPARLVNPVISGPSTFYKTGWLGTCDYRLYSTSPSSEPSDKWTQYVLYHRLAGNL